MRRSSGSIAPLPSIHLLQTAIYASGDLCLRLELTAGTLPSDNDQWPKTDATLVLANHSHYGDHSSGRIAFRLAQDFVTIHFRQFQIGNSNCPTTLQAGPLHFGRILVSDLAAVPINPSDAPGWCPSESSPGKPSAEVWSERADLLYGRSSLRRTTTVMSLVAP